MKPLKFRIWNKKSKYWVSEYENLAGKNRLKYFLDTAGKIGKIIYPLSEDISTLSSGDGSEDNIVNPDDYVVQQYTGLTDEHDVEVYEGDIILWTEYQGWEDGRTFEGFYEVKWNDEDLRFDFYDIHEHCWWPLADTQFNYVVGNIFQNPELLENE
jgi:uncharacterized phage protein (TIGR01671 family)